MEKVLTGRDDWTCISATTVEESTPPDKNAPNGTSAIICWRTASLSNTSSSSTAWPGVPVKALATPDTAVCAPDQYAHTFGSRCCSDSVSRQPGNNFVMPSYIEYGAGTAPWRS